jgi:hypothetical protein
MYDGSVALIFCGRPAYVVYRRHLRGFRWVASVTSHHDYFVLAGKVLAGKEAGGVPVAEFKLQHCGGCSKWRRSSGKAIIFSI